MNLTICPPLAPAHVYPLRQAPRPFQLIEHKFKPLEPHRADPRDPSHYAGVFVCESEGEDELISLHDIVLTAVSYMWEGEKFVRISLGMGELWYPELHLTREGMPYDHHYLEYQL